MQPMSGQTRAEINEPGGRVTLRLSTLRPFETYDNRSETRWEVWSGGVVVAEISKQMIRRAVVAQIQADELDEEVMRQRGSETVF